MYPHISQLHAITNDQSIQWIRWFYLYKELGIITSQQYTEFVSNQVQEMRNKDPIIQLTPDQKKTLLNGCHAGFFNSSSRDSQQQHDEYRHDRSPRQLSNSPVCPPLPSNGAIHVATSIWGDVHQINFPVSVPVLLTSLNVNRIFKLQTQSLRADC